MGNAGVAPGCGGHLFAKQTFVPALCKAVVEPVFRLDLRDGIHGIPHWSRVWYHGRRLAHSLEVNPAILAWFAFLHDSQRYNNHRDPQHGNRAADFAVVLRRQGAIVELDAIEFEHLCEAMRLHSDGHTEGEAAIRAGNVQTQGVSTENLYF